MTLVKKTATQHVTAMGSTPIQTPTESREMPDHQMGGCSCGRVRYRLHDTALIVHACHCRMCQRLSGSTNAVNVVIEAANIEQLTGETVDIEALTPSGKGQLITRCANCQVAVWSQYRYMNERNNASLLFVRAGTLDRPDRFPPDVHIFTTTMQPHFVTDEDTPCFDGFYDLGRLWPPSSLARLEAQRNKHSCQTPNRARLSATNT